MVNTLSIEPPCEDIVYRVLYGEFPQVTKHFVRMHSCEVVLPVIICYKIPCFAAIHIDVSTYNYCGMLLSRLTPL